MKHLVLGGAGFIGSHLCDALLARGDAVVAFDNMSTGRASNLARHLKDHCTSPTITAHLYVPSNDAFSLIVGDVRDIAHFLYDDFDVVWNLACPASPPAYQQDPIGTLMTCVVGTKNALDLARQCGPATVVVQASTSEVYGDPLEHPQTECYRGNVNPIGPRACYDEGKRAAEALCFDYRRIYGVDVRVARIFNTYGPRMRVDDGRVVSNFAIQALCGERLTVYGSGEQTRSFCYVSDLVAGLVAMGTVSHTEPGPWFDEPINLGNPSECTLIALARDILELTDRWCQPVDSSMAEADAAVARWNSLVEYRALPADDPCRRKPDVTRALKILGWAPKVERELGLRMTIEHFRREFDLL